MMAKYNPSTSYVHNSYFPHPSPSPERRDKDDIQAPPFSSIYDSDGSIETSKANLSTSVALTSGPDITSIPENHLSKSSTSGIRSATTAPFETIFKNSVSQTDEISDDRWVTVFGFSTTSLSLILRQFQKYGDIVRYQLGEGNWVYIQYQNKFQAQKAFTKNGKIIEDGLMIGVVPCSNRNRRENSRLNHEDAVVQYQYKPHTNSYAVEPSAPKNIPTPHSSIWSKIMEYIFNI